MTIREAAELINGDFNIIVNNIKLINNREEPIPEGLLKLNVYKIDFSDLIDLYVYDKIN